MCTNYYTEVCDFNHESLKKCTNIKDSSVAVYNSADNVTKCISKTPNIVRSRYIYN